MLGGALSEHPHFLEELETPFHHKASCSVESVWVLGKEWSDRKCVKSSWKTWPRLTLSVLSLKQGNKWVHLLRGFSSLHFLFIGSFSPKEFVKNPSKAHTQINSPCVCWDVIYVVHKPRWADWGVPAIPFLSGVIRNTVFYTFQYTISPKWCSLEARVLLQANLSWSCLTFFRLTVPENAGVFRGFLFFANLNKKVKLLNFHNCVSSHLIDIWAFNWCDRFFSQSKWLNWCADAWGVFQQHFHGGR